MDVRQMFDDQVSDGPPQRSVAEDVAGGRRRRLRQTAAAGVVGVVAAAAVIGGGVFLSQSLGSNDSRGDDLAVQPTAPATPTATEPPTSPLAAVPEESPTTDFLPGEVKRFLALDDNGGLVAKNGVEILKQATPSGLPAKFADTAAGDLSALGKVKQGDTVYWVQARRFAGEKATDVIVVKASKIGWVKTLAEYRTWAAAKYDSGEGLL